MARGPTFEFRSSISYSLISFVTLPSSGAGFTPSFSEYFLLSIELEKYGFSLKCCGGSAVIYVIMFTSHQTAIEAM